MSEVSAQTVYMCELCEQPFKREDHLLRHKLSHGKAKFQCPHNGCEMTFHRKDVLLRHEKVHEPNSTIKRRRPRRGPEPKPFVQAKCTSSSADWTQVENEGGQASHSQSSVSTGSASSSSRSGGDVYAGISLEALDFCYLHFAHSCMRRFPFVHQSALDKRKILPEKLLAMAVLGGFEIPQYQDTSRTFFERARQLLRQRQVHTTTNGIETFANDAEVNLSLFQAQVMLIEYTLWSSTPGDRHWATECAFRLANEIIPEVVVYLRNIEPATASWHSWKHQEQCIRTVWAYYCTTQKARPILSSSFSNMEILSDLWLPAPDALFDASDELNWKTERDFSLNNNPNTIAYFKPNLYNLMSDETSDTATLMQIMPLGRHVLLSALLDQYLNALVLPSNYSTFEAYRDKTLTLLKPRLDFMRAMSRAREVWWNDPVALFAASPPRGADLQNNLLMAYIEVLMFGGMDHEAVSKQHYLIAVGICCAIFRCMVENGVLEVATKAGWVTDGASRFYVTEFARVMVRWATGLQKYQGSTDLDRDDHALYTQCCASLHAFNKEFSHESATLTVFEIASLDRLIRDAWWFILRNRNWAEGLL